MTQQSRVRVGARVLREGRGLVGGRGEGGEAGGRGGAGGAGGKGGREAERGPSVEFQRVSGRVFSGMFLQNSGWRLKLLLLQLQEIM